MPSTRITTGLWAKGQEWAILHAVHAALVEAIRIPDHDRDIVIDLREPHSWLLPDGASERSTKIVIALFAGRSLEAKRRLYAAIVERLEPLGIPPEAVSTILVEIPLENWGVRGGVPASDVDLGFRIDV